MLPAPDPHVLALAGRIDHMNENPQYIAVMVFSSGSWFVINALQGLADREEGDTREALLFGVRRMARRDSVVGLRVAV